MPGIFMKDTLPSGAKRLNVSVSIEYRKGISILKDQSPLFRQGRLGPYVELIANLDYVCPKGCFVSSHVIPVPCWAGWP